MIRRRPWRRTPPDARLAYIAGGTDLLGLMKDRGAFPERLPDISELPDMGRIEELSDGGLRIGAAGPDERCAHGPDGLRALSGPGAPISRRRWPAMQQVAAGLGLFWGQPPTGGAIMFGDKLVDRSVIPLEFARDPATGEWRSIQWVT